MKKILFLICFVALAAAGCKKETEPGRPTEIAPVYTLPQPGTSAESSAWFVKMFEDYGSYFIWDFTEKDALWTIVAGGTLLDLDRNYVSPGDPEYADEMIEYLKKTWLNHVSQECLKNDGVPFRVFLADTLCMVDSTRISVAGTPYFDHKPIQMISGNSIIISGMNRHLPAMTPEQISANTASILKVLFPAPPVPDEFYEVSDYLAPVSWLPGGEFYESVTPGNTSPLTVTANASSPNVTWTAPNSTQYTYSRDETRRRINEEMAKRGFIMTFNPNMVANPMPSAPMNHNYPTGWYTTPTTRETELRKYDESAVWEDWLWKATDEQLAEAGIFDEEKYPLLWKKWQMRIKAYEDAGLDIRAAVNGR